MLLKYRLSFKTLRLDLNSFWSEENLNCNYDWYTKISTETWLEDLTKNNYSVCIKNPRVLKKKKIPHAKLGNNFIYIRKG